MKKSINSKDLSLRKEKYPGESIKEGTFKFNCSPDLKWAVGNRSSR